MNAIAYEVEDPEEPDPFIAKRVPSALLSPILERINSPLYVLLLFIAVALVALVAVMTWLGMTGKFAQGNIPTPFTTSSLPPSPPRPPRPKL